VIIVLIAELCKSYAWPACREALGILCNSVVNFVVVVDLNHLLSLAEKRNDRLTLKAALKTDGALCLTIGELGDRVMAGMGQ
jgi:hypothetical protein